MFEQIMEFLDEDTKQKAIDLLLLSRDDTNSSAMNEFYSIINIQLLEIQTTIAKLSNECVEEYKNNQHFKTDFFEHIPTLKRMTLTTISDILSEDSPMEFMDIIARIVNTAFGVGYITHKNRETFKLFENAFDRNLEP